MTDEQILLREEKTRATARQLLNSFSICHLLAPVGKVEFEGAFTYRVMVNNDIDILVTSPNGRKKTRQTLLTQIIKCNNINKLKFVDNCDGHIANKPHGIWLRLYLNYRRQEWNVDVWTVEKGGPKATQSVQLEQETLHKLMNLADSDRAAILRLKQHAVKSYDHLCRSSAIYQAYLEVGIRTPAALDTYIVKHRQEALRSIRSETIKS